MRNETYSLVLVIALSALCAQSAIGIHVVEMEICTDGSTQSNPDVGVIFIVWQDNRNGNWDIYAYDIEKQIEYAICTAAGGQTNPCIGVGGILDDLIIAWQDDRNGNNDIYGYRVPAGCYDLEMGSQIAICTDPCDQRNPVCQDGTVYWQDNRSGDWDIYAKAYEPDEEPEESIICNEEHDQINPAGWHDSLAWQDNRNGDWDIYGYDLSEQEMFDVCVVDGNQTNPSYFYRGFVWQDDRNGNDDIYGSFCKDILCSKLGELDVCTDSSTQICPDVSLCSSGDFSGNPRDWVVTVWQDNRAGSWDIYGYRLDMPYTGTEFTISAGDGDRVNPNVDYGFVVWQDNRNGNDDIYAARLCLSGNDDCDECAIELFDGQPYSGSTEGMSPTVDRWVVDCPAGAACSILSSCGFNDFVDAWHIYRPSTGGPVTITTKGSSLDTILSVFNSSLVFYPVYPERYPPHHEPIELACNDDYCLQHASSRVGLNVVGGKSYYIRVSGFNDTTGDYQIVVERGAATEPVKSDLNGDGQVDWSDFAIFASEWLTANSSDWP